MSLPLTAPQGQIHNDHPSKLRQKIRNLFFFFFFYSSQTNPAPLTLSLYTIYHYIGRSDTVKWGWEGGGLWIMEIPSTHYNNSLPDSHCGFNKMDIEAFGDFCVCRLAQVRASL